MKNLVKFSFIILVGIVIIPINAFAGKYHPAINYIYPLPESEFHMPLVTVIMKLDTTYIDDITDLSSLISVSGKTGEYVGSVFFAADNKTIIFKPDEPFHYNDTIAVQIQSSQLAAGDFSYVFYTLNEEYEPTHAISKMENVETISKSAQSETIRKSKTVNGVAVPSDFPDITTKQTGETAPGLIFFVTHRQSNGIGSYFIVVDNSGKPYYYLKSDAGNFGNATVHPNNILTLFSYAHNWYYVLDTTFTMTDTLYGGHGYLIDSHELQFLKNGHRLNTAELYLSNFIDTLDSHPQYLQELDTAENVIFEWRSLDFFHGHPHMNSIDIDHDGHYILSSRDLDEVTKINRETGEIIWRLGGDHDMFTYINDESRVRSQHDARPINGYPNHYLIYDNLGATEFNTRVVEYKVDTSNMTIEKIWEFNDPEQLCYTMGSSQRFENGNTFIDYPQPSTHAFEVNSAGEIVFEMYSTDHESYRCRRFDWYGKMKRPLLLLEDMHAAVELVFHQLTDSTVDYYKVYYGTDKNNLQVLDSTVNTSYIVENLQNSQTYYFGITSVNKAGVESGMSDIKDHYILYYGPLENIVVNGGFDAYMPWYLNENETAEAKRTIDNGIIEVEITEPGISLSDITVIQRNITLIKGKNYILEFDAYADQDRIIEVEISKETSPYTNYSKIGKTYITTQGQRFKYEFVMEDHTDASAVLIFNMGEYSGKVFLDNVSLKYIDEDLNPDLVSYARINFEIPNGYFPLMYVPDTGAVYGERWNDLNYGWLNENNNTIFRDTLVDARYQSFNHLKKDNVEFTWEIEVPNGEFTAMIGLGDPLSSNQINDIYVEGSLFPDTDGEDNYDELLVEDIEVEDGKLSIRPGPNAVNAKIAYVDIFYYYVPEIISPLIVSSISEAHDINIYPVPTTETIKIQFYLDHSNNVEIELIDLLGRSIDKQLVTMLNAGRHDIAIDISSLPSSTYIVSITIADKRVNRKIVVH